MSRSSSFALLVVALSLPALAQPEPTPEPVPTTAPAPASLRRMPNTWSNRASFFVAARGGLAIPPDSEALAPNASLEFGVSVPTGFGMGMRVLWMHSPPSVPLFDLPAAKFGFGAMADFRYYFETIDPLILYPTLSVGFLAGPSLTSNRNVVLPLLNAGLGAKIKLGSLYVGFEFGVSGLTIPFMALSVGYETDSKAQKEARRLNVTTEELLVDPGTAATSAPTSPLTPRWTAPPLAPQPQRAQPRPPEPPPMEEPVPAPPPPSP